MKKTIFTSILSFSVLINFNFCFSQSGWSIIQTNTHVPLNYLHFINYNTGYISASDFTDSAFIFKTTDSGFNWNRIITGSLYLHNIYFVNSRTGFCATGHHAYVYYWSIIQKTTNESFSWPTCYSASGGPLYDVYFTDSLNGFVCGTGGNILKTTDTGLNWVQHGDGIYGNLNSVFFIDQNTGWTVGNNGMIVKTTNGGINWQIIPSGVNYQLTKVKFINNSSGWITCNDFHLLRTTNGGNNWINLEFDIKSKSIFMINNSVFIVVGVNGQIRKTTNSGLNWYGLISPATSQLNDVFFVNDNTGFIVGDYGIFLRTTNGGEPIGIQPINNIIPEIYSLFQNYPNPFNPVTKINFDIPAGAQYIEPVQLIIYDLLGREVATLVNEQLKPGTYEVNWDGSNFASGVYFYKLVSGDYIETKKMILMK